jgi:hypothetical protein
MKFRTRTNPYSKLLLTAAFSVSLTLQTAIAQSPAAQDKPAQTQPANSAPPSATTPSTPAAPPAQAVPTAPHQTSPYRPGMSRHATNYYQTVWGVDSFATKVVESGEMIRFSYRVLDAEKAQALNDKRNDPALLDQRANVKLAVPSLEKVGQLRQSNKPEAGKIYWMVFSNKERYVKRGDRVSIVIGKFRVDGLLVD